MSRCELDPHWADQWPVKAPAPMPPRCQWCGQEWPTAGIVCSEKCAASHAATLAAYATGSCTTEERDAAERVEAAITKAAEDRMERERWRTGGG